MNARIGYWLVVMKFEKVSVVSLIPCCLKEASLIDKQVRVARLNCLTEVFFD